MKKLLSFALMALILLTAMPVGAAVATQTDGYYTYTVSNGKAIITACSTTISGTVEIPTVLGEYPVTGIGEDAFWNCANIESVIIPDGVESIGKYAFSDCVKLQKVTIPDSVLYIGEGAFDQTACESDTDNWIDGVLYISECLIDTKSTVEGAYQVKDGTKCIADKAFYNRTGLTEITVPDGVKSICDSAFYDCHALSDVSLPQSLTVIGNSAFEGCNSILNIDLPEALTELGEAAFHCCYSLESIEIPQRITVINDYTFGECYNLTQVIMPDGITAIGEFAFWNCVRITNITIPEKVTTIGEEAFLNCSSLKKVEIRGAVTAIDVSVFGNCTELINIYLPKSIKSIGADAFINCTGLENVYFEGTQEQWSSVSVLNDVINNAQIHYNSTEIPVQVDYIEFYNLPDKRTFFAEYDSLDVSGGKIKVVYIDGTSEIIDITVDMVSGYDNTVVGEQSLLVTYKGAKTGYSITIIDKAYVHNFVDGICDDCGAKQTVLRNYSFIEPPFLFDGSYIYNTYSQVDENADCFYLDMLDITAYDGIYAVFYVYDDGYNQIGEYTAEYLKTNIIKIEGTAVRLRLVSDKNGLKYNANLVSEYTFEKGDIDADFTLTAKDLTFMKGNILGINELRPYQQSNADINGDGNINILDFVLLQKLITA